MSYSEQQNANSDNRSSGGRYKDFKTQLYKTELCRSFQETGTCPYGNHCQFAHGSDQLRPVLRHRKFKTEKCRNFLNGYCPYGNRCCFVHDEREQQIQCIRASTNIVFVDDPKRIAANSVSEADVPAAQRNTVAPLPAPANPYEEQGMQAPRYSGAHNYQQMVLPLNPMNMMSPVFTGHQGGVLSSPAMGEAVSLPPQIMTPPVYPGYQHSPHLLLSPPGSPANPFYHNPRQSQFQPQYVMSPISPISPPQTGAQMASQTAQTHQIYNPGNAMPDFRESLPAQPPAQPAAAGPWAPTQLQPATVWEGENAAPAPYTEGEQRSSRKSSGEGMPSIMSMVSVSAHKSSEARGSLPHIKANQVPSSPAQNSPTSSSRRSNGVPLSPTTHNAGLPATPPRVQDTYTPPRRSGGFTGKMMGQASSLGIKAVINSAGFMAKAQAPADEQLTRKTQGHHDITAEIHGYLHTDENNAARGHSESNASNGQGCSSRRAAERRQGDPKVERCKLSPGLLRWVVTKNTFAKITSKNIQLHPALSRPYLMVH